jgi:hypothetical protein
MGIDTARYGPRTTGLITWGGGAAIVATAVVGLGLTLWFGEEVFAARLVAGLAGCL